MNYLLSKYSLCKFNYNLYQNKYFDNNFIIQNNNKIYDVPMVIELRRKHKNEQYEMKCQFCKSRNVNMHKIFILQECLDCKKEYVPNIEQLK